MKDNKKDFLAGYSQYLDQSGEHFTYAALSTYRNFTGELSQKERNYFERHFDACRSCSARLNEIAEVEGDTAEERPKHIQRIPPTVFRYAVAALLIFAVGMTVIFVIPDNREEINTAQEVPNEPSFAATTLDPEKFVPNEILENFIGRTVRSSSVVKLIVPGIGDTISTPMPFRWKGETGGKIVTLTVVDNKNVEVWKGATTLAEIGFPKLIEPGLYYVKIEVGEQLLQVGKFTVIR